jgi:hypothetical protein
MKIICLLSFLLLIMGCEDKIQSEKEYHKVEFHRYSDSLNRYKAVWGITRSKCSYKLIMEYLYLSNKEYYLGYPEKVPIENPNPQPKVDTVCYPLK